MPLLWTRIGLWTCWQSSRKNVIFIILFLEGVNDSQKNSGWCWKNPQMFYSYLHNSNFILLGIFCINLRRILKLRLDQILQKKYKISGSFCKSYKEMTHWWVFFLFSFFECWEACCKCDEIQKKVCFCWKMMRCANKFYNFLACKEHKIETFLFKGFLWATANAIRQISLKSILHFQIVWLIYQVFEFFVKANF